MNKGRYLWADVVRILAIYFVLVVHSTLPAPSQSFAYIGSFILFAIAKTCVPLFVMLSGALLLSKNEDYKNFFKKRVLRILPPWFVWTLIYMLFLPNISTIKNLSEGISLFKTTFQSFWFLPMIFILYVITPFLRKFVSAATNKDILYIIVVWFLAVSLLPYQINSLAFPLQVDDGLLNQLINNFGYFLIGYLIVKNADKYKSKYIWLFSVAIGILWITFSIYFFNPGKISTINYLFDYISPGIVFLSVGIFSCLVIYFKDVEKKINEKTKSYISTVSKATLGIYFISGLLTYLVGSSALFFKIFPPIDNYLGAIILFIISGIIIIALQKISLLKGLIS
jgi:surface polysaccharide O-acyltransferase-like enzyme